MVEEEVRNRRVDAGIYLQIFKKLSAWSVVVSVIWSCPMMNVCALAIE